MQDGDMHLCVSPATVPDQEGHALVHVPGQPFERFACSMARAS